MNRSKQYTYELKKGSPKRREQLNNKPLLFCPKRKYHTPTPTGYLNHLARLEKKYKQGYVQRKCIHCGLWVIWYKPI